ncbi:oxygenase, partial [Nocardia elegans]|nr:oxygenase [Nocardia elegans]
DLLTTAARVPEVANRFCNAFSDPTDLRNYFFDPELTARFLAEATARHELRMRRRHDGVVGAPA